GPLDMAMGEDKTALRRSSPQRVERGPVRELHTARACCQPSARASHATTTSGGEDDATSGSLEPKPKGEGTVWQSAQMNPPDQTASMHIANDITRRPLVHEPGVRWAAIGSEHAPRFTHDAAGRFPTRPLAIEPGELAGATEMQQPASC